MVRCCWLKTKKIYTWLVKNIKQNMLGILIYPVCLLNTEKFICLLKTLIFVKIYIGRLNKMMDHFKEHHPKNCNLNSDVDVEIDKVDLKENERYVYLLSHQNKFLFIMTFKIDIMQRIAYWVIQHIGPKKNAQQYVYEIHVTSKINNKRKYVYTETCFNDALKADEVFHRGQCPVMLLDTLAHFIKHRKLAFRFFIKRIPTNQPNKSDGNGNDDNQKGNDTPHKGPKGPGPKGPVSKGAGSKTSVPGPKKSQKSSN